MKDEAKNVPHLRGQKLSRQAKVRGKTDKEGKTVQNDFARS